MTDLLFMVILGLNAICFAILTVYLFHLRNDRIRMLAEINHLLADRSISASGQQRLNWIKATLEGT